MRKLKLKSDPEKLKQRKEEKRAKEEDKRRMKEEEKRQKEAQKMQRKLKKKDGRAMSTSTPPSSIGPGVCMLLFVTHSFVLLDLFHKLVET